MSKKFFLLIALMPLSVEANDQIFATGPDMVGISREDFDSDSGNPKDPKNDSETSFFEDLRTWGKERFEKSKDWFKGDEVDASTNQNEPSSPSSEVNRSVVKSELPSSIHESSNAVTSENNQESVETPTIDTALQQDAQLEAQKQVGEAIAASFLGVSFDKKTLMYFGAGAVALITIGGVTYVLYKNGSLKKINATMQQFVKEHKVGVASAVTATTVVAIAAICAKKYGITFEQAYAWVTNAFTKKKTETYPQSTAN